MERATFNPRLNSLGNGLDLILRKRKLFESGLRKAYEANEVSISQT